MKNTKENYIRPEVNVINMIIENAILGTSNTGSMTDVDYGGTWNQDVTTTNLFNN